MGPNQIDFHQLADATPATAWFANLDDPKTPRAYENDVRILGICQHNCLRCTSRSRLRAEVSELLGGCLHPVV
jgi:hypothetical protein